MVVKEKQKNNILNAYKSTHTHTHTHIHTHIQNSINSHADTWTTSVNFSWWKPSSKHLKLVTYAVWTTWESVWGRADMLRQQTLFLNITHFFPFFFPYCAMASKLSKLSKTRVDVNVSSKSTQVKHITTNNTGVELSFIQNTKITK